MRRHDEATIPVAPERVPSISAHARRRSGLGGRRRRRVAADREVIEPAGAPEDLREMEPEMTAVPAPPQEERCWRAPGGLWCPCGCQLPGWAA